MIFSQEISMEGSLPEVVNNRRRRNLIRYTLLAMLSYQLPCGVAYLAKVLHIAKYSYIEIHQCYLSFVACSLTALLLTRFKKQITKRFIYFILHFQVVICMTVAIYMIYVMSDQRYLVPIGCLCILMFVFIQSSLLVSSISIFFVVVIYLSTSYVGIILNGQPGSFVSEALYIMIMVPVCIFIAYMSKRMQDQQKEIKSANKTLTTAHDELATTHAALASTHNELEAIHTELEGHNERMLDSIRYAEMIQRSLLPGIERIKAVSADNMFIWMPKDIVGGDIFYIYADIKGSLIALLDCTGHGVPGAFLTIIAYTEIRNIIMAESCYDPAEILKRLNKAVKNVLHKDNDDARTNDGLDAAVCFIDHNGGNVTYAGAKIPLFYVKDGICHKLNGCKQSLGYKNSDDDFEFINHDIDSEGGCSFYMATDGLTDQIGGPKRLRFGSKHFERMIVENNAKPFDEQRKAFLQTLLEHKGDNDQKDDITLIGFRLSW